MNMYVPPLIFPSVTCNPLFKLVNGNVRDVLLSVERLIKLTHTFLLPTPGTRNSILNNSEAARIKNPKAAEFCGQHK